MMPFWVFTLGKYIFEKGKITIPYRHIATFVISLVIPLAIGFFIQRKFPRIAKMLIRIMKPFSVILILFIIIFAITTNLYMFKLFSWKVSLYLFFTNPWRRHEKKRCDFILFILDYNCGNEPTLVGLYVRFYNSVCLQAISSWHTGDCHWNWYSKYGRGHFFVTIYIKATCWWPNYW